jgi:3-oxoacyl-[acyl-carrier-protein] synthase-3
MGSQRYSVITGSGSYIPSRKILNSDFLSHVFYDQQGQKLTKPNDVIIAQLEHITGILERRYITDDLLTSDIASFAAREALTTGGINGEDLDYIIVAHNFGDVAAGDSRSELVPALASKVKQLLGIQNPKTVTYDLPFGCAGWLQGIIQADLYIKSGGAKNVLVIGAETLSRVCDPHDRDCMIFSDGAGAVILSGVESDKPVGILAHHAESHTELVDALTMGRSNNPDDVSGTLLLKMNGRKLYEHVLKIVPGVVAEALVKADINLTEVSKLLIHQANNKMDEAVLKLLYDRQGLKAIPEEVMPMSISWLGNSSVATLPTLYDLITKGQMPGHHFDKGSILAFAAVGAGLNVNALIYKTQD